MVKTYFSAPIVHPEIKDAYHATFGVPGSPRKFVMKNGIKQIFSSKETAELAGYRALMDQLNKDVPNPYPIKTQKETKHSDEINKVFYKFGNDKDGKEK